MRQRRSFIAAIVLLFLWLHLPHSFAQQIKSIKDPPDEWFTSAQGRRVLDNILTYQNPDGGWPKQYDYTKPHSADMTLDWEGISTIDNYGTYTEIRLMARAYRHTKDKKYHDAMQRGLKMLIENQYPAGGWPQRFPPGKDYSRLITFNDSATARVIAVLHDVVNDDPDFASVDPELRAACKVDYDRAIDGILNMQIKQNGKPAGWCSQHDPVTLAPAWGRSYEPPSINSSEGSEVVLLLMDIPNPDDRVVAAIEGAVEWFQRSKILGKRMEMRTGPEYPGGKDRVLVDDPAAPPIWARFYDIETNEPIFMDREGKRYPSMADMPVERRVGYAWYSNNGNKVLKEYAAWKERQSRRADRGEK